MPGVFTMSLDSSALVRMGWRPFFARQLALDSSDGLVPARVAAVHRALIDVITATGALPATLASVISQPTPSACVAVGDWVLLDSRTGRAVGVLERQSMLSRLAAGDRQQRQLIAANVDALFIVTSCNEDFNPSRLERYLALAQEAHVEPVVVLTKADLAGSIDGYLDELRAIAPRVNACAVNAMSAESTSALVPWLAAGQTVAFVGSSGVGKSTLVNTLTAEVMQDTGGIREHDSKGRHTTTSRHMFQLPGGAWVIDTPGMRELRLDVGTEAVSTVFSDIEALAMQCRFRDCAHQADAGCAVLAAIARNDLDERRLASYRKLLREAAHATRTTRERRESARQFGRMARSAMEQKRKDRGRE